MIVFVDSGMMIRMIREKGGIRKVDFKVVVVVVPLMIKKNSFHIDE